MLFPERLDDLIDADNPVRLIDAFVDSLDLKRVDRRIADWLQALTDNDDDDEPPAGGGDTQAVLDALKTERGTRTERIRAMDEAGLTVQPQTDPEARALRHGKIGYNVQTVVADARGTTDCGGRLSSSKKEATSNKVAPWFLHSL